MTHDHDGDNCGGKTNMAMQVQVCRAFLARWLLTMLGVALALLAFDATGQKRTATAQQAKGDDAKNKRLAVVIKYGTAKAMAELLTKHFKGAGEIQFLADAGTNMLLVNG